MIKDYKLTFILGVYTLISLLLFSTILLVWTYKTTNIALMKEIEQSFLQRQRTVHSIIDTEYDFIENFGSLIARSGKISTDMFQNNLDSVRMRINTIKDEFNKTPDIIFASNFNKNLFANASARLFNVDNILGDIANCANELVSSSQIKEFYLDHKKVMIILKATEIILKEKGKIVGYIFTGTVLEDNYSLLQSIRVKTDSTIVTVSTHHRLIATTDKRDSELTAAVLTSSGLNNPHDLNFININHNKYITSSDNIQKGEHESIFITIAISNIPLEKLKLEFFKSAIIVIFLSLIFLSFSIILLNKTTSIPLRKLVDYSDGVESGHLSTDYKRSYIKEYNKVGFRMESMVKTIKSNEERIKQIANATWEAIILHRQGILVEANDQFFNMFGYNMETDKPLLLGTNIIDKIYDKETSEIVYKQIQNHQIGTFENKAIKKDGTFFPIEIRVRYIDYDNQKVRVATIRDLSERKRMSELMIQTEKMLSIGGLAAGMAHEINNPLTGMMQSAHVIALRLGKDMDLKASHIAAEKAGTTLEAISKFMEERSIPQLLDAVTDSGKRAATIVTNMLNFARKSDSSISTCNLEVLIEKTIKLVSGNFYLKKRFDFKKIEIIREYPSQTLLVPCEGPKIQQVLLNIFRNGAEAMQETGIKNPRFIIRIQYKEKPRMISLEIEDNGPGMDESTSKHIFEPFYTTKPVGMGTGLGLSVSYFIITENHNGTIRVESKPGQGTKFIICLPVEGIYSNTKRGNYEK